MIVTLKGMVVRGVDGLHHDHDCCKTPALGLSTHEKGLTQLDGSCPSGMETFLEVDWSLPNVPRVGEDIELYDGTGAQYVDVEDIVYSLDGHGVEIWVGGWNHWETDSVINLFESSAKWCGNEMVRR